MANKTHNGMESNFPSDWNIKPLEECMSTIIDYRGKSPQKSPQGIPLITAKIVKDGRIERISEFIPEADYDFWMRRGIPKAGDIVMTTEAPLGEIAQLDERKIALAQRLITLRGKGEIIDNTFLKFLMQSSFVQNQLHSRATGTTVIGIKQSELRKVLLIVPSFPEQKAIAHILGSLDDKIELNRKMNETLEAMARSIFKSWFVDFDPVRAKAEGRDPGFPKEIADLFSDDFDDSDLGEIPKGWKAVRLPEVVDINPSRKLRKGEHTPYVDMSSMPTQGHRPSGWYTRDFKSGARFINGDTLLARITPCLENGKTAFVDFLSEGQIGWGSTEYIVLRPKPPLPDYFGYLLARDDRLRNFAIGNMTGSSGRQRVPADCFSTFLLAYPPKEIAESFGKMISSFQAAIKAKDEESTTLTAIRDALLPKLISGEVRVKEAEKFMGAVV